MQVRLSGEREFTLDQRFRRVNRRAEKTRIPNQCIDGVALPAAVLMVDAIALIVAPQESCIHEFGNGTAEIAFARSTNARAHFLGDRPLCILRIAREHPASDEVFVDSVGQRRGTRAALGHWRERVAKPVAQRNKLVVPLDPGTGASVGPGDLGNQIEQHEGVAGAA